MQFIYLHWAWWHCHVELIQNNFRVFSTSIILVRTAYFNSVHVDFKWLFLFFFWKLLSHQIKETKFFNELKVFRNSDTSKLLIIARWTSPNYIWTDIHVHKYFAKSSYVVNAKPCLLHIWRSETNTQLKICVCYIKLSDRKVWKKYLIRRNFRMFLVKKFESHLKYIVNWNLFMWFQWYLSDFYCIHVDSSDIVNHMNGPQEKLAVYQRRRQKKNKKSFGTCFCWIHIFFINLMS